VAPTKTVAPTILYRTGTAVLNWAAEGEAAVLFQIESPPAGTTEALGYVFTDAGCHSVSYDAGGEYRG